MALPLPLRTTIAGLRTLPDPVGHTHIVSIIDPEWAYPEIFESWPPEHRLLLRFHDELESLPGRVLPQPEDVRRLLDFGRAIDDRAGEPRLLVHCLSGVSRSTAAALMIWAQDDPSRPEVDLMGYLARQYPSAWPNSLMVQFADDQLGRGGRLISAVRAHFRSRLAAEPELEQALVKLRRQVDLARR
jgi:predicted protein tyrosine phosphatase